MTTVTKSATCCRCLRWHKREELTGDQFCPKCVGGGSLRGAKCRWCRGNLPLAEGSTEPTSATCDNCTKLQLRYGPPAHCKLCKLEAAFKTKRGSKICRRCDYCLKNYGKPQACQKCKVMAAWDGDKIEKFDGRLLCFICTFREKRKSTRTTSDKNKENKINKEKTSKEGPKKDSKGREDEKPDDKPSQSKEEKALEAILDIRESAVMEEVEFDVHTSASLATNQLTLKLKEMNSELHKRKKIIEERDVTIAHLKGLLTSKMKQHEDERRNWEARLQTRIGQFKEQISKLSDEIQSLKAERRIDKKKKKEKKNRKKGNTLALNNPEAVKMELFSNTLKRPQSSNKNEENENLPPKKSKKSVQNNDNVQSPSEVIKEDEEKKEDEDEHEAKKILESDDDENEEIKRRKIITDDEDEEEEDETKTEEPKPETEESNPNPSSPQELKNNKRKAKNDLDSDSDGDVEAALKEIDEEEKGILADQIDDGNSKDSRSSSENQLLSKSIKEPKEFSSSSDSGREDEPTKPEDHSDNPQNGETVSRGRSKPADFSSSDSETEEYVDTRFMW